MITNFKDFAPDKLVGQKVLFETGRSYDPRLSQSIRTITKVLKTGFRISGDGNEERLFDFYGKEKGFTDRMFMGRISRCSLLTAEEVENYRQKWALEKQLVTTKKEILERIEKCDLAQLNKILQVINNNS